MRRTLVVLFAMLLTVGVARAQGSAPEQSGQDLGALAKESQNPVANLNTIPFQWNFNSGGGLGAQSLLLLNVQPVLPLRINKNWLLVSRTIIPFVNIPGATGERLQGIADIQQQFYFSPTAGGVVWGAGPIFSFPTSNQPATQTGQYAIGPTAVVLKIGQRWVYGIIANNLWKFAGSDAYKPINTFFTQPFANFNLPGGWAISTAPAITANWSAESGQQWTVPVGVGFSKVTVVAKIPVNVFLQYYGNAVKPDSAPASLIRLQFNLMFPVAK